MKIATVREKGFTLVEIVIALGLFSFAIIGVVFLLGTGLDSSRETQRDSALSSALVTSAAILRSGPAPLAPYTNYFDQQGGLANTSNALFAVTVTPLTSNGGLSTNLRMYSVAVTGPYPSTNAVGVFLLSRMQ